MPPDSHVWVLGGDAPPFKSEGPLYEGAHLANRTGKARRAFRNAIFNFYVACYTGKTVPPRAVSFFPRSEDKITDSLSLHSTATNI
jgi:hypothetical protein